MLGDNDLEAGVQYLVFMVGPAPRSARVLVFCPSVEQLNKISNLLSSKGTQYGKVLDK